MLRDDFDAESDIDVLIRFEDGVYWPCSGVPQIRSELEAMFGRTVDVGTIGAVEEDPNPFRRQHLLATLRLLSTAEEGTE